MLHVADGQECFVKLDRSAVGLFLNSPDDLAEISQTPLRPMLRLGALEDRAKMGCGQGFGGGELRSSAARACATPDSSSRNLAAIRSCSSSGGSGISMSRSVSMSARGIRDPVFPRIVIATVSFRLKTKAR